MSFMHSEASRLRKELEVQEARVNQYKAKYRSELPEQLDANLRALDQLRRELEMDCFGLHRCRRGRRRWNSKRLRANG
jgi:hypothetical protein